MTTQLEARSQVILIIDDNSANLWVNSDYLEHYGFEILAARSGESCFPTVALE